MKDIIGSSDTNWSSSARADSSDQKSHQYADSEWFDYPGHYKVVKTGDEVARVRITEAGRTALRQS